MAFIVTHSIWTSDRQQIKRKRYSDSPYRSRTATSVTLTLSGPEREAARIHENLHSSWPRPHRELPDNEYNGWSSDFLELCNAQLHLLTSTISNLAHVALFFRHENPQTGALEFVPLIVHSSDTEDRAGRVWISSGSAGQTELEDTQTSRVLPGGIPAAWILPDYPFKTVGSDGGILMPDGGLCIPIEYNQVLAGSIVLVPHAADLPRPSHEYMKPWSPEDIKRAAMVAKSIALGAALEGKWHANEGLLGTSRTLIESVRSLLRTTLHQIRSPVSALVTFGHLLLRKLPPGDANRDLAKNMILESLRVDELLEPLDQARDTLVLPEASSTGPWFDRGTNEKSQISWDVGEEDKGGQELRISSTPSTEVASARRPKPSAPSFGGKQLLWLSDVLIPLTDVYSVLAREKGMQFIAEIDEDTPAVLTVEKFVREAVSNLIDNSLKYANPGSYIGISSEHKSTTQSSSGKAVVEVIVWDTGPGFLASELKKVWDFGFRGSAAERQGTIGSGLGLAIVRELLNASGATITLQSPLPSYLDPRDTSPEQRKTAPGCAFFIHFDRTVR